MEHILLLSTYTPLTQEYAVFVAWPSRRRVKAQDSYLSSSQIGASYPTIYLPLKVATPRCRSCGGARKGDALSR
jgi:hypothetical protein